MQKHKVLLLLCALAFVALLGGLIAVQMLAPPLPQPDSKYTEEKASTIVQYYEETVSAPDGGKKPLEIFSVTAEFSNYEKAYENGYTSYFYSFDKYGKYIKYTSDGKRDTTEDECTTSVKAAVIEALYDEVNSFKFITSNLEYDVPTDDSTVKVYLSTNKGYCVREYALDDYVKSCFAEIHEMYKIW